MSGGMVYFDGACVLCNGLVDHLLRADRKRVLRFSSLQSRAAARDLGALADSLNTLVYARKSEGAVTILTRSDAVFGLLSDLGGVYRGLSCLRVLPRSLRDGVYDLVARNRHRVFGRREACRLPSDEERDRFIE